MNHTSMFTKICLGSLCLLLCLSACETNNGIVPTPSLKYNLRLVNLHAGLDQASFRFFSNTGFEYTVGKLDFEDSWPSSGYAEMLVTGLERDTTDSTETIFLEAINPITREVLMPATEVEFVQRDFMFSILVAEEQGETFIAQLQDDYRQPRIDSCGAFFTSLNYFYDRVSYEIAGDTTLTGNTYPFRSSTYFPAGNRTLYVINEISGTILDSLDYTFRAGKVYDVYFTQNAGDPVLGVKVLEE